jgi:LCP family protein required for cell wall assembly
MGYERFKNFVSGKNIAPSARDIVLNEREFPKNSVSTFTLIREKTSLLWLPFIFIFNKLRYNFAARILGIVICIAIILTGSWLAVVQKRVSEKQEWLADKNNLVIALMGKDDVEGMGRSDTLILVNVKYDDKKINMLSVPRDSRVPIRRINSDGTTYFRYSKINHALRWGGVDLTKDTVERYLGINIDYHFIISYGLFVELIDFIGGIPLDVEKRMYYVDRAGGLTIDLREGYQILDGNRALQYVRFRHDKMGDIGRIERQQKFIKAAVAHVKKPEVFMTLVRHAPELLKHISTDVPIELVPPLLYKFKDMKIQDIKVKTLPGTEKSLPVVPGGKTKGSFYVSSKAEVEETINNWFLEVKEGEARCKPNDLAFIEGADDDTSLEDDEKPAKPVQSAEEPVQSTEKPPVPSEPGKSGT